MDDAQKKLERQFMAAQYIQKVKQKEWLSKAKLHIPQYAAEYLFYQRPSCLYDMLKFSPNHGFIYDPETLLEGIEMLMKILDSKDSKATNPHRLQQQYLSFADAKTRVEYLRTFAEYLELYPIIGNQMIADLNEVAKTTDDPDFHETLEPRIKTIKHMMKQGQGDSPYERQ